PEPCHLPTSPDADGRFVIEADVISGYEASYKPVRVVPDAGRAGVWHITSIETYLGSQVAEMEHIFILSGTKLIEQDGKSRVVYAKCTGKQQGPHGRPEPGIQEATDMNLMQALQRATPVLVAVYLLVSCGTTTAARSPETASVAATGAEAAAEYPAQLRGHWMPEDMACTSPINYDSDSLVVIEKSRLGHYEDANTPIEVRQISSKPQAWSVQSLLNVGGDGYDTRISEIFVLGDRKLGIAGTDGVRAYQKCD